MAYEAPAHVRRALASMGRTEDIRFSPSGRRVAFACYARNEIALVDVAIDREAGSVKVAVTDVAFCGSPAIREPHGLDFVDENVLVVANRGGVLDVLRIPQPGTEGGAVSLASISCEHGATGSVVVCPTATGEHDVLAVHNWANAISRYRLTHGGSLDRGDVIAHRWLDLPDGIAMSTGGRWLAVSNHNTHDVLVFEAATVHRDADPVGVLRGVSYPHGIRFAHGDRVLLVADAGGPYVDVFARAGDSWAVASYPTTSIRVMDDQTFAAGHLDPQEGGPKGLDVDPNRNVLVVTSEHAPVTFFDLDQAIGSAGARPPGHFVQYELNRLRDLADSKAETDDARDQLRAVLTTRAWRITKPLRLLSGALRR
jgi:hypothetical protein